MSKYSAELQQQIYEADKAGQSIAEIAALTGKRYQSIRSALRSNWFAALQEAGGVAVETEAEVEQPEETTDDVVTEVEDEEVEDNDEDVVEEVEEEVEELVEDLIEEVEEVLEDEDEDEDEDEVDEDDEEEMVWYEDDEPGSTPPF